MSQKVIINEEMDRSVLIFLEVFDDIIKLLLAVFELLSLIKVAILQIKFTTILQINS